MFTSTNNKKYKYSSSTTYFSLVNMMLLTLVSLAAPCLAEIITVGMSSTMIDSSLKSKWLSAAGKQASATCKGDCSECYWYQGAPRDTITEADKTNGTNIHKTTAGMNGMGLTGNPLKWYCYVNTDRGFHDWAYSTLF